MAAFETLLRLVQSGDPVDAAVVNTPLRGLGGNVQYLWDLIRAAGLGSTVYLRRQTVEEEVLPGFAVWYNAGTQRFERALDVLTLDPATGLPAPDGRAQVLGVVAGKANPTLADILLFGVATIDLTDAADGAPAVGPYYLSAAAAGHLVTARATGGVPVLRHLGDNLVLVAPRPPDAADLGGRHTHLRLDLTCRPAGDTTPPAAGERHTVADADDALAGWLPADHASFAGLAPAGAAFGYNLAADPTLADLWPPLPLSNAYLEWDTGRDATVGSTGVALGADGLCLLDAHGLWWLSDCYGEVPWPLDLDTTVSASASDSASESAGVCPHPTGMRLTLWLTRANLGSGAGLVTSLSSTDARVRVRCRGSDAAAAGGDLEISLHLAVAADTAEGYLAVKEFDEETGDLRRGPLVEGLYALSDNLTLTGSTSGDRVVGEETRRVHQGLVGLSVAPASSQELDVQLVRLDGATEEFYDDPPLMYIGLAAGELSSYRAKIHLPESLGITSPTLRLRLWLLGRGAGTLPQLTFTARRVAAPGGTPATLPTNTEEFVVTCVTTADVSANQYVEVTSDPFEVAAGDTLFFTVERADDDSYAAQTGVLRQAGLVAAGA